MLSSLIIPVSADENNAYNGVVAPNKTGSTTFQTSSDGRGWGPGNVTPTTGNSSTSSSTNSGQTQQAPRNDFDKFTDIKGHWGEKYMKWAYENNLFTGVSATQIDPNGNITRAQMATVITNAFGATKAADISMFIDVNRNDWFYDPIAKAVNMGIMSGFGNAIVPAEAVTRQEVAVCLVKAAGYNLSGGSYALSRFTDASSADPYAVNYLGSAITNGLMTGNGDGTLNPAGKVTRAQFAVMMYRMANAYMNSTTTYTSREVNGSLAVGVGGITLDNMTITGNLFLTDGVGTGEVTLSNTKVAGTIFVRGTGPNGLHLTRGSTASAVVLCNPNSAVFLDIDDTSRVSSTTVRDANSGVSLTGRIGNLSILTGKASVKLTGATVGSLDVDAKGVAVTADKATSIGDVSTTTNSLGSALDLAGSIGQLSCSGDNSTIRVTGSLTGLSFGSHVNNVSLTLPQSGTMSTVDLPIDGLNLTLGGNIKRLNIGGDKCDIKLAADSHVDTISFDGDDGKLTIPGTGTIDELYVRGNRDVVNFANGCEVKKVYTYGDDLELTSSGVEDVVKVEIRDGEDITLKLPGTTVYNKDGKDVIYGDNNTIRKGSTITLDSKGTGDKRDEDDKKNQQNQQNKSYTIRTDVGDGGRLEPSGSITVRSGDDKVFTITCENGYIIDYARLDGVSLPFTVVKGQSNKYTYTVKNITSDKELKVRFKDDPDAGGYHEPNGTRPTLSLRYASGAMPSDFGFDGAYTLASFGSSLDYDPQTGKATGTVNAIRDFKWFTGDNADYATEYYLPLVLKSNYTTNKGVLKVGDATFGKEVISTGSTFNGSWMVYVPLNSLASSKNISVSYDPDGDGSMFSATSVRIDYSAVRYYGGVGSDTLYRGIKPIPGQDGAETAQIAFGRNTTPSEPFEVRLATTALLETRNSAGRYGNWTGLYIPVQTGADGAKLTVTSPNNSKTDLVVKSTNVEGMDTPVIVWEVNAGSTASQSGNKTYTIDIQWRRGLDNLETEGSKTLKVDLSEVVLAGSGSIPTADPPLYIVAMYTPTDEELKAEQPDLSLDDFGMGITVDYDTRSDTLTIGGTYFPLPEKYATAFGSPYVVPVYMEADLSVPTTVLLGTQKLADLVKPPEPDDPSQRVPYTEKLFFIPLSIYGTGASDFRITFQPTQSTMQYTKFDVSSDTSGTALYTGGIVFDGTIPTGTVDGKSINTFIEGQPTYQSQLGGLTLSISGTSLKQTGYTFGTLTGDIWLVPVSLFVKLPNDGWTVEVDVGSDTVKTYKKGSDGDHINILVPVAKDGEYIKNAFVTLKDVNGKEAYSCQVSFTGDYKDFKAKAPAVTAIYETNTLTAATLNAEEIITIAKVDIDLTGKTSPADRLSAIVNALNADATVSAKWTAKTDASYKLTLDYKTDITDHATGDPSDGEIPRGPEGWPTKEDGSYQVKWTSSRTQEGDPYTIHFYMELPYDEITPLIKSSGKLIAGGFTAKVTKETIAAQLAEYIEQYNKQENAQWIASVGEGENTIIFTAKTPGALGGRGPMSAPPGTNMVQQGKDPE